MLQPDTKKMLNVDSQKRKSSCKQSFLKRKCCFQQESLQSELDKTESKKFFPLSLHQKENQMLTAQLDSGSHTKERSLKIKRMTLFFPCFRLNKTHQKTDLTNGGPTTERNSW